VMRILLILKQNVLKMLANKHKNDKKEEYSQELVEQESLSPAPELSDSPEVSVKQLLKKVPGVEIDEHGHVSFNGKPVRKLLIEGDDFWGGDYKEQKRKFRGLEITGIVFGALALLSLIAILVLWAYGFLSGAGDVGDLIGGISGPLGSLAALLYVIHSVNMQKEDLAEQRKETAKNLRLQRDRLEQQRKEIEQNQRMQQQEQFSEMFFNYLAFLRDIVHEMKYKLKGRGKGGSKVFEGHSVFRGYAVHLIENLKADGVKDLFTKKHDNYYYDISTEEVKEVVRDFFDANGAVSFYFSNLYGLLSMVDQNLGAVLDKAEQEKYIQIIENQLTSYAKLLLAIYALCKYADNGVQEYIDEDFYETFEANFDPFWKKEVSSFMLPPNVHIFKR